MQPGLTIDEILHMVCHEITNRKGSYIENEEFMKEVIDLYRYRTGKVPVIIIQADQCLENQEPAKLVSYFKIMFIFILRITFKKIYIETIVLNA